MLNLCVGVGLAFLQPFFCLFQPLSLLPEKLIIHSEFPNLLLESADLLITFICLTGFAFER
jgi:hypothetical protein